jgi:hypothetical protein
MPKFTNEKLNASQKIEVLFYLRKTILEMPGIA